MPFIIKPNSTIVFIGDSITDCGRDRDVLGVGYVHMIHDLVIAKYPTHKLTVVNRGIGGNNIRQLSDRWHDDIIVRQPDWVSCMVGINDVNQWLSNNPAGVNPEEYEKYYDEILSRTTQQTKAKLVLCTPFFMSHDRNTASYRRKVNENLLKYQATTRKMAKKYGAKLVEFDKMFERHLKLRHPDTFGSEPVHPNQTGHQLLSWEWLRVVGF